MKNFTNLSLILLILLAGSLVCIVFFLFQPEKSPVADTKPEKDTIANPEKSPVADTNRKAAYDVVVHGPQSEDFIGRMANTYIKRYFNEMGVESIKDQPTNASVFNYYLSVSGNEKGNKFNLIVVYGVAPPSPIGTMPDDLQAVSMDIAKRFQMFIELCEESKAPVADTNRKAAYDVVVHGPQSEDFIGRMANTYIKHYFNEMGVESIKDQPTNASVLNYALSVSGNEKGNKFNLIVVYGVAPPSLIGTMPDDLETVSMDIAKRFQMFIELCEESKEFSK